MLQLDQTTPAVLMKQISQVCKYWPLITNIKEIFFLNFEFKNFSNQSIKKTTCNVEDGGHSNQPVEKSYSPTPRLPSDVLYGALRMFLLWFYSLQLLSTKQQADKVSD